MTALPRAGIVACLSVALSMSLAPQASALTSSAGDGSRGDAPSYHWVVKPTRTQSRLRGLSVVSSRVVWASGYDGTVIRTLDGGRTWTSVGPDGAGALQFRDIEATSARHAVAMSAGVGEESRIYVTDNGGRTWIETFRNTEPTAFYDCMAFLNPRHGFALSDPVDGQMRLVETRDGGHSWSLVDTSAMPSPRAGEYFFAASGTCMTAGPGGRLVIASGGVDPSRVYATSNAGRTWTATDLPIPGSASAGSFSIRMRDARRGVVVGGDYLAPDSGTGTAAYTVNGGRTWAVPSSTPRGYRSGVDWVGRRTAVAVGPNGSDLTRDGGRSWHALGSGSFDAVECTEDGVCFASGELGRVARLTRGD